MGRGEGGGEGAASGGGGELLRAAAPTATRDARDRPTPSGGSRRPGGTAPDAGLLSVK